MMTTMNVISRIIAAALLVVPPCFAEDRPRSDRTVVSIVGDAFHINGEPTYRGREFEGMKVEGLLMNARLVQAIFDDRNPETRHRWKYPDGDWDAERNTREFIAMLPEWRKAGLLSFTVNLQGGSPEGYSKAQPWHNSAFESDGTLRPDYLARLKRVLDRANELGMAPMLGFFYFGQAPRFQSEAAVVKATENAVSWILAQGYSHVLIEIANEANHGGYPAIIQPARADELMEMVKRLSRGKVASPARRLLVSTSLTGGQIPNEKIVRSADFLLLHGNGVGKPDGIRAMVERTRAVPGFRGQPVVFNEDDHFEFDKPDNNFRAALSRYASWGYFDFRRSGEGFREGYQSVPVDWTISSERKRGFFELLRKVTGAAAKD